MTKKVKTFGEETQTVEGSSGKIVIYQPPEGGGPTLDVRLDRETVWLDAHQMAALFGRDRTVIVRHIRNVYAAGELARETTCAKNAQVAADGKVRQMDIYNLDMILSVGYRVNSRRGTQFRIWATGVLREHLVRGITINRQRIETNAREIEAALELARPSVVSPQLLRVSLLNRHTHYKISPGPSFPKRGIIPPFIKGRSGGISTSCRYHYETVNNCRHGAELMEEELNTIFALPAVLLRRAFNGEI